MTRRQRQERAERRALQRVRWRNREISSDELSFSEARPIMLRVKWGASGKVVETSTDYHVRADDVLMVWMIAMAARRAKAALTWKAPDNLVVRNAVDATFCYRLESVTSTGHVKVNCHRISWVELNTAAHHLQRLERAGLTP